MARSEREKMEAGDWYTCLDPELAALRDVARTAVKAHNSHLQTDGESLSAALAGLFARHGDACKIEVPFHCAYGFNIALGDRVYLNAGCTILDTAPVIIGSGTMIGPAVQIYCAQHHKDRTKRAAGLEIALPVTIGADVWIGGGAILMPGITMGDGAIIGAGSVVTSDVAPDSTVAGNPARALAG